MAKMFYTLEEAAEQLGVGTDRVEAMVENGELQQFRDGEKRMFKVDQVDQLAGSGGGEGEGEGEGESAEGGEPAPAAPTEPSTGQSPAGGEEMTLSDTGTGGEDARSASGTAIPLAETGHGEGGGQGQDQGRSAQSGVDVFNAGEVENAADPGEQTQVTSGQSQGGEGSEEMSLESAGSGSGLLDLTRESDDTSLGAELFDELYPAEGSEQSSGDTQSGAASSGVMEGMGGDTAAGGTAMGSGVQATGDTAAGGQSPAAAPAQAEPQPEPAPREEPVASDPAGNGLGGGFMLGAGIVLIIGMVVAVAASLGMDSALAAMMTQSAQSFYLWIGGLVVLSVICGLLGMALGNAAAKGSRRSSRAR